MGRGDALGPVTGRAAAAGLVVLRMAAPAGRRGVHWCQSHELPVAGRAAELDVTLVWEGDRPIARGFPRCGDGEVEVECLGEAFRLVTPGTVVPRRIGVVANLATPRRLEGEQLLRSGKVADEAGYLCVPRVCKRVARHRRGAIGGLRHLDGGVGCRHGDSYSQDGERREREYENPRRRLQTLAL